MILVIPAIELREGICAHSIKGEDGMESLYDCLSNNPIRLCNLLRKENAKTIHITDFDSYEYNRINTDSILFLAESLDIPVQLLSDFKNYNECRYFLDNGIYRIIISRLALTEPASVLKLIEEYSISRIIFSLWADDGIVKFKDTGIELTDQEFIRQIKKFDATRLVYAERNWIKSDSGPDYRKLKKLGEDSGLRITLFESIYQPEQLWELQTLKEYGIDSVIIGNALYENKFPCQKIWRLIEAQLENGMD